MEKQGGMAFGFRKMATAVIEPDKKKINRKINAIPFAKFTEFGL
jgi:hypothetical protein